jgi:hypothetical protein
MDESGEAEGAGERWLVPEPALVPPAVRDFEDTSGEVEEDEYGEVIEGSEGASKTLFEELHAEGHLRASSSIFKFLVVAYRIPGLSKCLDRPGFPSIDRPPPADILDQQLLTVLYS